MITCKRATELISRSMEENISVAEQIQLKLHLFLCEWCCHFQKQMQLLRQAVRSMRDREQAGLSEDAKERLKKLGN